MSRSRASTPAGKRRSSASRSRTARTDHRAAPTRGRTTKPARRVKKAGAARAPRSAKRPARAKPRLRRPRRARTRRPLTRFARWRRRFLVALVLVAALAAGYWFWLRDSSLVAVTDVEVAGVTAGDRQQIVAELSDAGEGMTTLHVQPELVEDAAAAFPTIESVSVSARFPHGLTVDVAERPPTMLIEAGGREVAIAADGTVLAGLDVSEARADELPAIELDKLPAEGKVGGEPLQTALIAGAAPEPLRPLISELRYDDDRGVVATLRGGIPVFFGSGASGPEKWAAASAVLADPNLDSLSYVDARVPERVSAGDATRTDSTG